MMKEIKEPKKTMVKSMVSPLQIQKEYSKIKPKNLSLEQWQVEIRRHIAADEDFHIKNKGNNPIFSKFEVTNPRTGKTYRVVIRGDAPGINYCSCPDFSVNTLGTCKHIENVIHKLRRKKNAGELLKKGFISEHSSVTLRYGIERKIYFSLGITASSKLKKLVETYFDTDRFLTKWGLDNFDEFVQKTNALHEDIRYYDDAMAFIAHARDMQKRATRIKALFPYHKREKKLKQVIKANLYSFQQDGVLFAASKGRCLIADDMGLGKTIQAIAASQIMAKAFGIEKVLIICPTTLKYQWKHEIEKFTDCSAFVIQGMLSKRHAQYRGEEFFKITNYDVIHRDIKAIESWAPDLIILDEAQRIKNWQTRLARAIKQLNSIYAIVLTGTPLENRLEELHSIVEFIDRHHLGPLFRFLDTHQLTDETGKVVGYRNLNTLGKTLEPMLIRRRKKDVLSQLPERSDKNYFVPMTPEQTDIHEENRETAARIAAKWRRHRFLSEEDKDRLMRALQNMRMVSDDVYLIDHETQKGNKISELEIQLEELFEYKDTKVVIFSQWLRMFELVTHMLEKRGWKYVWLHGSVPSSKRGALIKTFYDDPDCRIFLSTEAGGTGLNLQNAATVINLDLPWNPAVLEQRISRVHRFGQQNKVNVINFVSLNSLEYGLLSLLKFKRSMFSGVLDGGANEVYMGKSRFNKFMETVETAAGACEQAKEKVSISETQEAMHDQKLSKEEISEETYEKESVDASKSVPAPVFDKETIGQLLKAGASFLEQLSQQQFHRSDGAVSDSTDDNTGGQTMRIPLPNQKTMEKIIKIGHAVLNILKEN